jgi:hypothetical protein
MEGTGILWLIGTVGGVALLALAFAYGVTRTKKLPHAPRGEAGNGLQPTRMQEDEQTAVRAGSREGVVNPIMLISTGLAILAMILVFIFAV